MTIACKFLVLGASGLIGRFVTDDLRLRGFGVFGVARQFSPSQRQSAAAKKLLESGKSLFVSKSVVLELEWVLRGYYKSPLKDVLIVLEHLLAMPKAPSGDLPPPTIALRDVNF